jgi:subfamily B ATP-binding cassette protein HlyB/CyaB
MDSATDFGYLKSGISRSYFLWVLGSICRIHSKPFDPQQLIGQFPPPYQISDLMQAAELLGFQVQAIPGHIPDPEQGEQPFLVFKPTENPESRTVASNWEPAIVANQSEQEITLFSAGTDKPQIMDLEVYQQNYYPWSLHFISKVASRTHDEVDQQPQRFGFKWFVPELLKHKRIWRDVIIASLAIQVMGLATPLITQVIIDKVIVHHSMNTLYVVSFALFMFMTFSALMTWIRQYLVLHTGNRVDAVLGANVFSHLFALPMRYFEHRATGTLVARVQGLETIREFITGAAVTLLLDLPFMLIFLAVMFFYSWQLTLIVVAVVTIISLISLLVAPTLRHRLNEQFQLGARNQAFLTEYINGVETAKSLQMEPQLHKRFGDYLATYLSANFDTKKLSNTYNVSANTLEQFQVLAILGVGAWMVMQSDGFTVGMLVAFQMFAQRFSQPLLRLVGLWLEFQQANIAVKRLGDIMDVPTEPYSLVPSRDSNSAGKVAIQNLGFKYADDRPSLYQNLNLTLEPGKLLAVMGTSGTGKSTLAKLLLGFYQPTEGRILVDGRDIRHLSANELRQYFGVVPQETTLYSGTIYDNLLAANPQASFKQIIEACKMAEIHETVEAMPEGYQTLLGENGTGLSGGQKQRIAIARALLKRPKILIFDEATSSLDKATEEKMIRTINQLKGKVAMMYITHHLNQTLKIDNLVKLG